MYSWLVMYNFCTGFGIRSELNRKERPEGERRGAKSIFQPHNGSRTTRGLVATQSGLWSREIRTAGD